ncbi:MAG: outer membrane beta-barrel protein [Gemmatimonadota bacterium]
MIKRLTVMAVFAGLLAASPQAAHAQLRFHLGAGVSNPTGDFGDLVDSGFQGRGGVSLGAPLFPLSARAEVEASRFPASQMSSGNATLLGGNLSVILSLGGIGISPYVLAGVGSYRVSFSDEFGMGDATTDSGYHLGFGVNLGILGFGGFLEARFVNVSRDAGDLRTIPVTFGVRF